MAIKYEDMYKLWSKHQIMRNKGGNLWNPDGNMYQGMIDLCAKAKELNGQMETILEIGSFMGESMYLICKELKPLIFISVDPYFNEDLGSTWKSPEEFMLIENACNKVIEYVKQEYGTTVIKIRGTSDDAVKVINTLQICIDMIYIDGAHDYINVLNDLRNAKHIDFKYQCVLAGHDYVLQDVKDALEKVDITDDKIHHFADDSWMLKECME
jgi:hypothetical protein